MLQGLEGGAADPTSGVITLLSLQQFIDKSLQSKEQRSFSQSSKETNTNGIIIGVSIKKYNEYRQKIVEKIQNYFPDNDTSFPQIEHLYLGSKKLQVLKTTYSNDPNIDIFSNRITSKLDEFKKEIIRWCGTLSPEIREALENGPVEAGAIDQFVITVSNLEIDNLQSNNQLFGILNTVAMEVKQKVRYQSENDKKFKDFLVRFVPIYQEYANQMLSW